MGSPLHVLMVEDSARDAALLIRELRRAGYEPTSERVETPEAMLAALEVLARRWSNHRPVLTVLHLAEKSSDVEIRAALGKRA